MTKLSRSTLRNSATDLGVCVIALFVLSQEVSGAKWLESVSKVVEWTGMVFLPLFGLNLDLYSERAARISALGMITIHIVLVTLLYKFLSAFNFITITPML